VPFSSPLLSVVSPKQAHLLHLIAHHSSRGISLILFLEIEGREDIFAFRTIYPFFRRIRRVSRDQKSRGFDDRWIIKKNITVKVIGKSWKTEDLGLAAREIAVDLKS